MGGESMPIESPIDTGSSNPKVPSFRFVPRLVVLLVRFLKISSVGKPLTRDP